MFVNPKPRVKSEVFRCLGVDLINIVINTVNGSKNLPRKTVFYQHTINNHNTAFAL